MCLTATATVIQLALVILLGLPGWLYPGRAVITDGHRILWRDHFAIGRTLLFL